MRGVDDVSHIDLWLEMVGDAVSYKLTSLVRDPMVDGMVPVS